MARYRHYRNSQEPGISLFLTTTVLDFVHAFRRPEIRTAMVECIGHECKRANVTLHAFVVMPHHIHLVMRLPADMTGPQFTRVLKSQSAKDLKKLLRAEEIAEFSQQLGLNRHTFWKDSFRSIPLENKYIQSQKIEYTHLNPVKAEYVEQSVDYEWSSAWMHENGLWSEEIGLPLDRLTKSER